ncbi:winged helix-turn-helix domain-containing protein [Candidatus Nanohalococcus occultus]|uniref:DUF2582 family protein n=1 Tax=Candidatus Nanohalococcus occultus TaxID=2978047 RepID=A0ABY8CEF9_9ARCH|nr:DUF2582 family protein [Candidatus Nanohaloarchaeota archaeon SVXNc]
MNKRIGELAGKVWNHLEEEGETSLTQVSNSFEAPKAKVDMAIGWLAKEGKLEFVDKNRGQAINLREN